MKLYATSENAEGKTEGIGSERWIKIELSKGNKKQFNVCYDGEAILVINKKTEQETDILFESKEKDNRQCKTCKFTNNIDLINGICGYCRKGKQQKGEGVKCIDCRAILASEEAGGNICRQCSQNYPL